MNTIQLFASARQLLKAFRTKLLPTIQSVSALVHLHTDLLESAYFSTISVVGRRMPIKAQADHYPLPVGPHTYYS